MLNSMSEFFTLLLLIFILALSNELRVNRSRNQFPRSVNNEEENKERCNDCNIKHVLHMLEGASQEQQERVVLVYDENKLEDPLAILKEGRRDNYETPLHRAVLNYQELSPSLMDEFYSDINKPDGNGKTPLLIAVETGQTDSTQMLLDMGADPSICDVMGKTALTLAAEAGDESIVEKLVRFKDLIDHPDKDGVTPIWYAALGEHWRTLAILIRSGAKVSQHSFDNPNLNKLFHQNDILIEKFLESNLDALLLHSCLKGYQTLVEFVLECGANPNSGILGNSNIRILLTRGKFELVDLLIFYGLDIEVKDYYGYTILHTIAIANDNIESVQYLIDNGFNINVIANNGLTPLDLASGSIWRLLRSNGAKTAKEIKATNTTEKKIL